MRHAPACFASLALLVAACGGGSALPEPTSVTAAAHPTPSATPTAPPPPSATPSAVVAVAPTPAPPKPVAEVEVVASRPVVAAAKEEEVYVRVRVHGLPIENTERPPLNVALVVDTSGSMDGPAIERAREACGILVDALKTGDALSIVSFGSKPKVVVAASRLTDERRSLAKAAIASIRAEGTTDMAGGISFGLAQARELLQPDGINRLVLLGDGVPNDPAPMTALADQARALHVPVTSLGLGPDFDETLMTALAQRSGGTFHFINDAAGVSKVFQSEIAKLERLVARNAWIEVTPGPGVTLDDAIGLPSSRVGRGLRVQLGDLTEGQTRDAIVRARVTGRHDGSKVELLDATGHFTPAAGGAELTASRFAAIKASSDAGALKESNRDVEHQATRLRVADAIVHAMASARGGDVAGARKLLDAASKLATEGAKRFDDAELTAKAKEIAGLKKTIASLAPAPPPPMGGGLGGVRRPSRVDLAPAAALDLRSSHGKAMSELQGD